MMADAVIVELVSATEFPVNREKSREFCKIAAAVSLAPAPPVVRYKPSDANSLLTAITFYIRE